MGARSGRARTSSSSRPADRVGGKVVASDVPGWAFPLDDGADAFLARVPDALELCAELGIDDLVHPATGQAYVYAHGALRPLPKGQLLGAARPISTSSRRPDWSRPPAWHGPGPTSTPTGRPVVDDVSVGALVRERSG